MYQDSSLQCLFSRPVETRRFIPKFNYVSTKRNHRPYRGSGVQSLALNLEYGVQSRPSASNILGGQCSTRTCFYPNTLVLLFSIIPQASIFHSSAFSAIWWWLLTVSLNRQNLCLLNVLVFSHEQQAFYNFLNMDHTHFFSGASH